MGRLKTSLRYVTDTTGPELLSLAELGGGGGNPEKNAVFVTCERVTRS